MKTGSTEKTDTKKEKALTDVMDFARTARFAARVDETQFSRPGYIATCHYGWGRGETIEKAVKRCKANKPRWNHPIRVTITIYLADLDQVTMLSSGGWEYTVGYEPKEIGKVTERTIAEQIHDLEKEGK